jgi:hypothetical protein
MHGLTVAATSVAVLIYALSYNNTWGGRFFFPALLSLAILLSAGWLSVCGAAGRRSRAISPTLPDHLNDSRGRASPSPSACQASVASALVLLNLGVGLYALFGQVLPRYGPPRPAWPYEVSRATPVGGRLGEVAEVVGYRLDRQAVGRGEVLAVTVYWRPLAPTPVPYTVFIHIFSPVAGSLAQRDTYPGLGTYPTTGWQPGRVFADTYRLRLADDVASPGAAYVVLGLYDEITGERLPAQGRDAVPEQGWIAFGQVTVEP